MYEKFKFYYSSFFPVLIFIPFLIIYFDNESFKVENYILVIIVFIFLIPFINRDLINFKKKLIFFYIFSLVCLVSCLLSFSNESNFFTSLKRYVIVFFPSLIIAQYYANFGDPKLIFSKSCKIFVYFTLILCLYSFIIVISTEFSYQKAGDVVSSNFFKLGQLYSLRSRSLSYDLGIHFLRPSSLFSNTIGFSQIIFLSLIMLLNKKKLDYDILSRFIIILFAIFLLWTFSRINLLILVCIPIVVYCLQYEKLLKFSLLIIVLFYIPLFLYLVGISLNVLHEFYEFNDIDFWKIFGVHLNEKNEFDPNAPPSHPRASLYIVVLSKIKTYIITGVGFGIAFEGFLIDFKNSIETHSHLNEIAIPSVPLTILLETGVFGFLFYLLTIFKTFDKSNNKDIILKLLIIYIFLSQLFDISLFRFHPLTFLFSVFLGIISNEEFYRNEKY